MRRKPNQKRRRQTPFELPVSAQVSLKVCRCPLDGGKAWLAPLVVYPWFCKVLLICPTMEPFNVNCTSSESVNIWRDLNILFLRVNQLFFSKIILSALYMPWTKILALYCLIATKTFISKFTDNLRKILAFLWVKHFHIKK